MQPVPHMHSYVDFNQLKFSLHSNMQFKGYVRKRNQTQQQILETARVQLQQRGLKGFTMYRLANDTGIVPATLYRYFGNKESILDGILKTWFQNFALMLIDEVEKVGGDVDLLVSYMTQVFYWSFKDCPWSQEWLSQPKLLKHRIITGCNDAFMQKILVSGTKKGIFDVQSPETLARSFRGSFLGNMITLIDEPFDDQHAFELQLGLNRILGIPKKYEKRNLVPLPEKIRNHVLAF